MVDEYCCIGRELAEQRCRELQAKVALLRRQRERLLRVAREYKRQSDQADQDYWDLFGVANRQRKETSARIASLEAALREIATHETGSGVDDFEDMEDCYECGEMQKIATAALEAENAQLREGVKDENKV